MVSKFNKKCTDRRGTEQYHKHDIRNKDATSARYTGYKPETLLLKKGSIRLKGYKQLECDIIMERDVPVVLRDEVTIYIDIFRPNDNEKHPAIMAKSPYGKEIGSQWLDDTPNHAEIPMEDTSGLQKFEGPDPSYWCNHGYAIINPDVRGAYKSEGVILFFGSDYGRDGEDIIEWAATQDWCNGKLGMSGNSWLAISQWFTAAQQPEHLAAIAPWEGFSDALEYFNYIFKIKDIKKQGEPINIYITFETTPMIGPHIPVGDDEITYKVDASGNKTLVNFIQKKSYEIPLRFQHNMIKPYP